MFKPPCSPIFEIRSVKNFCDKRLPCFVNRCEEWGQKWLKRTIFAFRTTSAVPVFRSSHALINRSLLLLPYLEGFLAFVNWRRHYLLCQNSLNMLDKDSGSIGTWPWISRPGAGKSRKILLHKADDKGLKKCLSICLHSQNYKFMKGINNHLSRFLNEQ